MFDYIISFAVNLVVFFFYFRELAFNRGKIRIYREKHFWLSFYNLLLSLIQIQSTSVREIPSLSIRFSKI